MGAIKIGDVYTNKKGHEFVIIGDSTCTIPSNKNEHRYRVRFLETGYEVDTWRRGVLTGGVKDRLAKDFYGVGCIGGASTAHNKYEYGIWAALISRCYSPIDKRYKDYGGAGVTVASHWHNFENFLRDIQAMEGYDKQHFGSKLIALVRYPVNGEVPKVYSADTCKFIPTQEVSRAFATKTFRVHTPSGETIIVKNLSKFCRDNALHIKTMASACKYGYTTKSGWSICLATD